MMINFKQKVAKIAKGFQNRISLSSSRPSRASVKIIFTLLMFSVIAFAEVAPVTVSVPKDKAWVGQRVTVYVDLLAPGSFVGTASFELPSIPGALLMKIGSPVTSSREIEGKSWFVQTHEFALFSQKAGLLELPAFPVSFSRLEGFVGEATDVKAQTSRVSIEIQRPPGSERIGFLVTTESLDVTETWSPSPGSAQVGATFKRTIIQRASNLPGMALVPAPTTVPDGIKVYPGPALTKDDFQRGNFLGERRETITYLLQKSGPLTLPALTYEWWNPKTQTLESKTLPAVSFEVAAPPVAPQPAAVAARRTWPWLLAIALLAGLSVWQRHRVLGWATGYWRKWNPPDRVAARQLLRACRHHDAAAAAGAWNVWRATQPAAFQPGPELRIAVLALQRQRFGAAPAAAWQGENLARAFRENLAATKASHAHESVSILPELNPPT